MRFQAKSFLEYVCYKLLGHPTKRRGNGESQWPCPRCDHPRFHTRPCKSGKKDRFYCWRCGWWGDEADLMKELIPGEDWNRRSARLLDWQEEYERKMEADAEAKKTDASTASKSFSFPGRAAGSRDNDFEEEQHRAIEAIFDLSGAECLAMEGIYALMQREKVSFEALYKALMDHYKWIADGDGQHIAECEDPECDVIVCRAARGLPPLTQEEIEAELQETMIAKQKAHAARQRCLKKLKNKRGVKHASIKKRKA